MKSLVILVLLLFQGTAPQADLGVVSGRLLNTEGKPAAGVRVSAMALPEFGLASAGSLLSIVETDAEGQYRLEKIPPGRYFITAGLIDAPTYYPGAGSPSGAKEVLVTGGKTTVGIDFKMVVPAGFKVSGRVAAKPSLPNPQPLVLASSLGVGSKDSPLQPDGTFEFLKVVPGTYQLQTPFGLPTLTLVVSDHDIVGLEIGAGPGVRVSGRVFSTGTPPGGLPIMNVLMTGPPNSLSARPNGDGVFEFLKVPPGNYTVRILGAGGGPPITSSLTVGDKDIAGLELSVPFQTEIPGHVVMADGTPFRQNSPQGFSVEARYANGSMGSGILPDGSFRLRASEGEYQIGIRGLPLGYSVKSVSTGGMDLLQNKLRVAPGEKLEEILLTIAAVPIDSIKGVRFSGRLIGMPASGVASLKVVLNGSDPGSPIIETTPNPDGTYEFAKVPSGTYTLRITGVPNLDPIAGGIQRFYVGDENVSGIQIPLSTRTIVSGTIIVVDQNGRPHQDVIPSATVTFRRGNASGSVGTSLRPDGTFSLPLEEGDQTIVIDRLPPQYNILAITAGSADLMKSPLKVDKNAPPPEIKVRLEFKP